MDVSCWISHWASWSPDKVAIRFEGTEISYRDLERRVACTAGGLRDELEVRRGDRVAYLGPSSPRLLELLFACGRLGAVLVPLNVRMPAPELSVLLESSEPAVIVVDPASAATARDAVALAAVRSPAVLHTGGGDEAQLDELVQQGRPLAPEEGRSTDAPLLIAYTSGTTGVPRGALLTHESLIVNALNAVAAFDMAAADRVLTNGPMFHMGALNIHTTPAMSVGATVTIQRRFDPGEALAEVGGTTLMIAVPSMTRALVAHPAWASTDLSSLRCVVTGSTLVPDAALRPWLEREVPVCQVYGLTETAPIVAVVPMHEAARMGATAGKPAMWCRIRVVDDTGADVGPDDVGEILVRGGNVMKEYWRNPGATEQAFDAEGWFRTGDAGFVDEEGFLHVVERIKEIIVVGSSNVYPADVEQVLTECHDVLEAAVVARPDPDLGEVPVAFVVLRPGSGLGGADVRALFDGRLASYKHPRDVILVERLPRTAFGKVQRSALRMRARGEGRRPLVPGA